MPDTKERILAVYHEYPRPFWTLVIATFIDRIGGALLFPFFALYLTKKFSVGMTEVGVLFAIFAGSSFIGSMLGGALTDRLGRKGVLIFSLIATSLSAIAMGLVESMQAFFVLAVAVGILTDVGGPAHQAIVADLLPEEKRAQGYGIIRVAFNVSVAIGPAIGGFLAARSYLLLFIADAIISLITAAIVYFALPETRPESDPDAPQESVAGSFRGYFVVLRDRIFLLFMGACMLMALVYMNMNTTLGVYLRDAHAIPEYGYGFILSLNAIMVVFLQFPITRRIEGYPPMLMMALGTFLYAIGFAMYGFTSAYSLFLTAMVIITLGEMLVAPVSQAVVANLAPEDMRGRYMAVFGISWGLPFAIGPYLAGLILDNTDPRILWYAAGIIGMLGAAGFLRLHYRVKSQPLAQAE
ncbi:MAG TPA: MFS transporter [Anaerolineales bacterium]|nr:MFS transporter [Anaerolineales bacterium]